MMTIRLQSAVSMRDAVQQEFASSTLASSPAANGLSMKKKPTEALSQRRPRISEDEILPQYSLRGSRRSAYAARLQGAVIAVTLEPDVAAAFPNSRAVNSALRKLIAARAKSNRATKHSRSQ